MEITGYDRAKELKQFDESKAGVKGLVDSGLKRIPSIFIQPPEILLQLKPIAEPAVSKSFIPIIDLSGVHSSDRSTVVKQVATACRELGFFQVVSHGIAVEVLDYTISAVKRFHEQPTEEKARWYGRGQAPGFKFFSNFDLYFSKAASWRDTLQMKLNKDLPELDKIPEVCRNELLEWDQQVTQMTEILMELLCEGLGLDSGRLKEMTFLEGRALSSHYYPHCPQPNLTIGTVNHTDPNILTVLLQDHVGGLQVKCGGQWVDVEPIRGALVVNIGDVLQMISNDEYQSVEHRVLANPFHEPRVSIAFFFNPGDMDSEYGPLPELTSPEKPSLYRPFTMKEALQRFFSKGLDGKSLTNIYKIPAEEIHSNKSSNMHQFCKFNPWG